jgi:uncharacterized membrane protein YgcG
MKNLLKLLNIVACCLLLTCTIQQKHKKVKIVKYKIQIGDTKTNSDGSTAPSTFTFLYVLRINGGSGYYSDKSDIPIEDGNYSWTFSKDNPITELEQQGTIATVIEEEISVSNANITEEMEPSITESETTTTDDTDGDSGSSTDGESGSGSSEGGSDGGSGGGDSGGGDGGE